MFAPCMPLRWKTKHGEYRERSLPTLSRAVNQLPFELVKRERDKLLDLGNFTHTPLDNPPHFWGFWGVSSIPLRRRASTEEENEDNEFNEALATWLQSASDCNQGQAVQNCGSGSVWGERREMDMTLSSCIDPCDCPTLYLYFTTVESWYSSAVSLSALYKKLRCVAVL